MGLADQEQDSAETTEASLRERASRRAWASLDAQDARGQTGPYWDNVRAMAEEFEAFLPAQAVSK